MHVEWEMAMSSVIPVFEKLWSTQYKILINNTWLLLFFKFMCIIYSNGY